MERGQKPFQGGKGNKRIENSPAHADLQLLHHLAPLPPPFPVWFHIHMHKRQVSK